MKNLTVVLERVPVGAKGCKDCVFDLMPDCPGVSNDAFKCIERGKNYIWKVKTSD